ncbi:glycosyltransferase [Colwelliaceae bacterium 6441]
MSKSYNKKKRVIHLIDRLTIGGLERIIANFVLSPEGQEFENIVVSIRDVDHSTNIMPQHIKVYSLSKKSGLDLSSHYRFFILLRKLNVDIVHTYNLPAIEYHPISWLSGVKGHVHAEHGRDISDPKGLNKKHNLLRKLMSFFIHKYICVSQDLFNWLTNVVGISKDKAILIQNGINTERFNSKKTESTKLRFTIVARISPVKDHQTLLEAFVHLKTLVPEEKLPSLTIVGDGEQRSQLEEFCQTNELTAVEFLGARDDIEDILAQTDVFVLSSIAEGIPMTILEAMSASIPIVATKVGGIPEVVKSGHDGFLVEKSNPVALAQAMEKYIKEPSLVEQHGKNARTKILEKFDEKQMVASYFECYQQLLKKG